MARYRTLEEIFSVSQTFHDYWIEEDWWNRSIRIGQLGKVWAELLPEDERDVDWLEHLANLPIDPHIQAYHLCCTSRLDLFCEQAQIVFSLGIPGWMIQAFEFNPDDWSGDRYIGYPGIDSDGIGPIVFCPYCGERLEHPTETQ